MKYIIKDCYDETIGHARSIKDALYQVQLHIQNGLAETYKETCRSLRWMDCVLVTDITFGTYFWINKA